MPIVILSKDFEDVFSDNLTYYKANAGDTQTVTLNLVENISVVGNSTTLFSLNFSNNCITWSTGNFLNEGFRLGDEVNVTIYKPDGSVKHTYVATIAILNANQMYISTAPHWYNPTTGETLFIEVIYKSGNGKMKGLLLDVNHVELATAGTANSLIDGNKTQFTFDLAGTTTGSFVNGTQVGFKSGQFNAVAVIEDKTTYPSNSRIYELTIGIIQSGVYDSSKFDFANCLKSYFGLNFQREFGNPNNMLSFVLSDSANTGWFDEPYNAGVIDAVLVQGISSLDYSVVNTGQIVIDSASSKRAFGACYIPTDESYFKNKFFTQSQLGMLCPSQAGTAPITITSSVNPSGAGYTIKFENPTTIGTVTTWDYTFTPNAQFTTFMDGRVETDRLFYVWAKYGSMNLLLFSDQLTKADPPAGNIEILLSEFVDHSQNITYPTTNKSGFEGNIEDDIDFLAVLMIKNNDVITSISPRIEAYNTVTNEKFTLFNTTFDLTSVPIVGGKQLVNQSIPLNTELPTTSEKRNATLVLSPTYDTLLKYAMTLSFPFLYDWRYWIAQPNADSDFYPNQQNKNWYPFDSTGNWTVRLAIDMVKNGLNFTFTDNLTIKNYDSDANIFQEIELFVVSTNQNVSVIVDGELHKVVATHTNVDLSAWNPATTWGMITLEPTESAPRWICSTVVPFDSNTANPLTPITGLTATLTFPSPNVAKIECYFDPSKINLSNGVKFTTKIKGCYV
jgi:hypothetical protein